MVELRLPNNLVAIPKPQSNRGIASFYYSIKGRKLETVNAHDALIG